MGFNVFKTSNLSKNEFWALRPLVPGLTPSRTLLLNNQCSNSRIYAIDYIYSHTKLNNIDCYFNSELRINITYLLIINYNTDMIE